MAGACHVFGQTHCRGEIREVLSVHKIMQQKIEVLNQIIKRGFGFECVAKKKQGPVTSSDRHTVLVEILLWLWLSSLCK